MSLPGHWSPQEVALLERMYPEVATAAVAAWLDRPEDAVKHKAQRLRLTKSAEYLASEHRRQVMGHRRVITEAGMLSWLTEHVHIDEAGCRIWAGGTVGRGDIPKVMWNRQHMNARRLLMTLAGRDIEGKHVYALCGKPRCMNLDCLRAGSHKAAMRSSAKHGAFLSGARRSLASSVGRAKNARLPITERHVVTRLRAQGKTWREIGELYGVTPSAVAHAVNSWNRATGIAALKVTA